MVVRSVDPFELDRPCNKIQSRAHVGLGQLRVLTKEAIDIRACRELAQDVLHRNSGASSLLEYELGNSESCAKASLVRSPVPGSMTESGWLLPLSGRHPMRRTQSFFVVTLAVAACSDSRNVIRSPFDSPGAAGDEAGSSSGSFADSSSGGAMSTSGGGTTSGGPDGMSGPGADSSGPGPEPGTSEGTPTSARFDVAGPSSEGGSPACDPALEECGCNAVDMLFVFDTSGSQGGNLKAMRTHFPGFVDAMYERLPTGTDLHVGVTSSAFGPGAKHDENLGCGFCVPTNETYCPIKGTGYNPGLYNPPTGPGHADGLQGRLYGYDGKDFFATNTSNPDREPLKAWFSGAAGDLATRSADGFGDDEYGSAAAAWAFDPVTGTPGFVRDEGALLLLFLVGDADHSYEVEDPDALHEKVVAAKRGCGGARCIVSGAILSGGCVDSAGMPLYLPEFAAFHFLQSFGEQPVWVPIGFGPQAGETINHYPEAVGGAMAQLVADTCKTIPPPAE